MTELKTTNITMNNLPASQLENMVATWEGDLYQLAKDLKNADNKIRYVFAATIRRIEKEDGKDKAKAFLRKEFGEGSNTFVFAWLQAYDEIKDFNDDAKELYFSAGEGFGVTLGQYIRSTSNLLEKSGENRINSDQFIDIVNHVQENNLSVREAKQYIDNNYSPKQDGNSSLGASPAEMNDINFKEKVKVFKYKLHEGDGDLLDSYFDNLGCDDDPLNRGRVILNAVEYMVNMQNAGG